MAIYYQLTNAVKRRLIRELQGAFRTHPVYEKITITNKYQLDEKTKYGIIVKNSNAEQSKLSADNFLGTVNSRVALVNISGSAIEWVREDSANLVQHSIDDVSEQADGDNRLFELANQQLVGVGKFTKEIIEITPYDFDSVAAYVDSVKVSVDEINPSEGLVKLTEAPPSGALVKIAYYWLNLAPVGVYGVEIDSPSTFVVDPILFRAPFSLNLANLKQAKLTFSAALGAGIFTDIQLLVDGNLVNPADFSVDAATRTLTFKKKLSGNSLKVRRISTSSFLTAGVDYFYVARNASDLLARRTSGVEKILDLEQSKIVSGTLEIWVDNEKIANQQDSLTDAYSPDKITFTLVDDYKVTFSKSLPAGKRVTASYYFLNPDEQEEVLLSDLFDDSIRVMLPDPNIIPKSVDVWVKQDLLDHKDFTFDSETNDLVLLIQPSEELDLKVSYYYSLTTQGPYNFRAYEADNTAIPGCVLNFAKQAEVGGKQLIFISDKAEPTAAEYGGKFRVTFSLDVVALDPIQQEEITDLAAMYLLALKELFDSEGLIMEEVSIQGEAEEPYDENTTDQYYMASIGVTFLTDWHIRKALPFKIRDTQVKFIATVFSEISDMRMFISPSLYPILESPVLKSERIT